MFLMAILQLSLPPVLMTSVTDIAAEMPATEELRDPNNTNSQDSSDSQEIHRYPVYQRRPPSHLKEYVSSQEIHRNKK